MYYEPIKLSPWLAIWFHPLKTLDYLLNSKEHNTIWIVFLRLVPIQILSAALLVFNILPDKKIILFMKEPLEYIFGFIITSIGSYLYLFLGCWLFCEIDKLFNGNVQKRELQIVVLWSSIIPLTILGFIQSVIIWIIPIPNSIGDCIFITLVVWHFIILVNGTAKIMTISNIWNGTIYIITVMLLFAIRFLILAMLCSDYTRILIEAG